MSTAPSGNDASAVYTTEALALRWCPDGVKIAGSGASTTAGRVTSTDITDLIRAKSREVDGELWAAGFRTPFPDIAATNPRLPDYVRDAVTYRVAADIRGIAQIGNLEAPGIQPLDERAQKIIDALVSKPHMMGKVAVTTPEDFTLQAFTGGREAGFLTAVWYRLKNRDVEKRTLRFVGASPYKEAGRTEYLPFIYGADWTWIDPAEGVLSIVNPQILSAVAGGGGAVYTFGWVRLDRFRTRVPVMPGVMR